MRLKSQLQRVSSLERAIPSGFDTQSHIDRAYGCEIMYLYPPRRDPIDEALAYRRPFPEWTPRNFMELVGEDPATRHPYAACMGFKEIAARARKLDVDAQAILFSAAKEWHQNLQTSGNGDLADPFWWIFETLYDWSITYDLRLLVDIGKLSWIVPPIHDEMDEY